jgi:chaperone required for assembly of F1-ATPase
MATPDATTGTLPPPVPPHPPPDPSEPPKFATEEHKKIFDLLTEIVVMLQAEYDAWAHSGKPSPMTLTALANAANNIAVWRKSAAIPDAVEATRFLATDMVYAGQTPIVILTRNTIRRPVKWDPEVMKKPMPATLQLGRNETKLIIKQKLGVITSILMALIKLYWEAKPPEAKPAQ